MRIGFCMILLAFSLAQYVHAADPSPSPTSTRPWAVFCARGLDSVLQDLETLLGVADQPELAEVLARRAERWRDFSGLDRTKPLGLIWTWPADDLPTQEVLFLPVADPAELMRTVTFDMVPFRKTAADRYEIERPGSPYHVLARGGYFWLGDDPAQLQIFSSRRDSLTKDLVKQYDLAASFDLRQVPAAVRRQWAEDWRSHLEPLLQQYDGEAALTYRWRRTIGRWLVDLGSLGLEHTARVVIGCKLDRQQRTGTLEVLIDAEPGSPWAARLADWKPTRSRLQQLDRREAAAMGVISVPAATIAEDGPAGAARNGDSWEVGWQVFGELHSVRSAVVVLRQRSVAELIGAVPPTVPDTARESGVLLQRINTPMLPLWLRRFVGADPEVWMGRQGDTAWLGFGPPDPTRKLLGDALNAVSAVPERPPTPVLVSARVSMRDLLDYVPAFSSSWAYELLRKGDDQVRLTIDPRENGLRLRLTLETGVLRLLGGALADDLAAELEGILSSP